MKLHVVVSLCVVPLTYLMPEQGPLCSHLMIYSTSCLLIATGPRVRVLDLFLPDLRPPEGLRRQTSRETLDALTCSIHVQGRSGDSDRQVE